MTGAELLLIGGLGSAVFIGVVMVVIVAHSAFKRRETRILGDYKTIQEAMDADESHIIIMPKISHGKTRTNKH